MSDTTTTEAIPDYFATPAPVTFIHPEPSPTPVRKTTPIAIKVEPVEDTLDDFTDLDIWSYDDGEGSRLSGIDITTAFRRLRDAIVTLRTDRDSMREQITDLRAQLVGASEETGDE